MLHTIYVCVPCLYTYDTQCGKTALMPYANGEGPDERAHPCGLILTFSVH